MNHTPAFHPSVLLAALVLLPALGQTEELNLPGDPDGLRYTFIEGNWITQDVDDLNIDGEGYALRAGMRLDRNLHLFGDYARTNLDPGGLDLETSLIGFGYAFEASQHWDLIGRAGWARTKLAGEHEDGWGAQALVRGKVAGRVEIEGGVQHVDFGSDGTDDTSFVAGVRYNFTRWFSAGVDGSIGGDVTQYGASVRFSLE